MEFNKDDFDVKGRPARPSSSTSKSSPNATIPISSRSLAKINQ